MFINSHTNLQNSCSDNLIQRKGKLSFFSYSLQWFNDSYARFLVKTFKSGNTEFCQSNQMTAEVS